MAQINLGSVAHDCIALLKERIEKIEAASTNAAAGNKSATFAMKLGGTLLKRCVGDLQPWVAYVCHSQEAVDRSVLSQQDNDAENAMGCLNLISQRAGDLDDNLLQRYLEDPDALCDRLNEIFDNIGKSVANLDRCKGLLDPHRGMELSRSVNSYRNNHDSVMDRFRAGIRDLRVDYRKLTFSSTSVRFKIQLGELDFLWNAFPRFGNDLDLGGAKYPGPLDGFIIPPKAVAQAREILTWFGEAWRLENTGRESRASDSTKLNNLTKQAKIALTLHTIRARQHFNAFVENELTDEGMDNHPDSFIDSLGIPDLKYFQEQYSRTRKPNWTTDKPYVFQSHEPIPLQSSPIQSTGIDIEGGFARVDKVQDLWEPVKTYYARKIISTVDECAELHMATELKQLKDLAREDHIFHFVRLVKSYQRGHEIGALLLPVANMNLHTFLIYCARWPQYRTSMRPALLRAFGCLTYSLCYLHNIKLCRHRDIKPGNILYVQQSRGKPEQFLWADFGLAYAFTLEKGSRTNHKSVGTEEYAAPEMMQTADKHDAHGRAADIFSLGCVFLEIASVLTLPYNESRPKIPLQQYFPYKKNIDAMKDWCHDKITKTDKRSDPHLPKILDLGREMIHSQPKNRPYIGKVAETLDGLKQVNDRNPHPFCETCEKNFAADKSRRPNHQGIFTHKKVNWARFLHKIPES